MPRDGVARNFLWLRMKISALLRLKTKLMIHTHIYEHTYRKPIHMSTSEVSTELLDLEIHEITTGASLSTGTSPKTEKHSTVKS